MNTKIKERLLGILYPNRCPFCDRLINENECACEKCKGKLPEFSVKRYASGGCLCPAPFIYSGCYADAVKRFKFKKRKNYSADMAFYIAGSILELYPPELLQTTDYITCVPMHKKDFKRRRYNQAELLGRECSALLGVDYLETLKKVKYNKKQHTLNASQRYDNVKGVFGCIAPQLVKGKTIIIIDDIITTGATLGECAKTLKKAGCANVNCAVFCAAQQF